MKFVKYRLRLFILTCLIVLNFTFIENVIAFEGGEHKWLGQTGYFDAVEELVNSGSLEPYSDLWYLINSPMIRVDKNTPEANWLSMTYGDAVALGGDFFAVPEEIFNVDELQFLWYEENDVQDLLNYFSEELSGAIAGTAVGESYLTRNTLLSWNSEEFIELALHNSSHFVGHNLIQYLTYHRTAVTLAVEACSIADTSQRQDLWNQVRFINAYADHFLTDMFSAGHMRVPREEIIQLFQALHSTVYVAGPMSKILHDYDNKQGLSVTNSINDPWQTYGDKYLFDETGETQRQQNRLIAREAVKFSVLDILNAFLSCTEPTDFRSLRLIPVLDEEVGLEEIFNVCMSTEKRQFYLDEISFVEDLFTTIEDVNVLVRNLPRLMAQFRSNWSEVDIDMSPVPSGIIQSIASLGYMDTNQLANFNVAALEEILAQLTHIQSELTTPPTGMQESEQSSLLAQQARLIREANLILTQNVETLQALPSNTREQLESLSGIDLEAMRRAAGVEFESITYENPCENPAGIEIIGSPPVIPDPSDVEVESATLLDLIFVIDTTGSMADDIDEVKRNALAILERIAASEADWRIGIVTYRDHPGYGGDSGDFASEVNLNFSANTSQIQSAINAIEVNGGGDTPESVYSGLMTALEFDWRNGAKKAIVLMGDAPPHDPEPVTGLQMDDVLQYAFNLDPVNIYPLLIADNPETRVTFQQLADGSSGRMFYAASAEYVIDTMFTTIGSIAYEPELSRLLEPGEEARVFTTNNDSLNLRENPGLGETILDRLANGEIVTIIDGPIYGDTYLWWNIRTDDDNVGWSVQAADGIVTLVPLSFTGDSSYIPPDDRDSTPPDAFLLSGGRGLTDGRILPPGEFQVEWYCGARGLGVSNDNNRWYCNNRGGGVNFTLSVADFDEICKATYGNASAFAVQDGRNGIPAYNWRCYAPR